MLHRSLVVIPFMHQVITFCASAAKAVWAKLCTYINTPSSLFAGSFGFCSACEFSTPVLSLGAYTQGTLAYDIHEIVIWKIVIYNFHQKLLQVLLYLLTWH